jgi:hypothetical protein
MPEYRQYETPDSSSAVAALPKSQMIRVSDLK